MFKRGVKGDACSQDVKNTLVREPVYKVGRVLGRKVKSLRLFRIAVWGEASQSSEQCQRIAGDIILGKDSTSKPGRYTKPHFMNRAQKGPRLRGICPIRGKHDEYIWQAH